MDKAVKDGLERVSWVFRCVDAISQTQARIPMELRKIKFGTSRQDANTVEDVRIWKLLNYRSNPYESSFAFRYRLSATLLLSRRGAFVEMVRGQNGDVVELHLMSPGMVEPIPDPNNFVSGYQIMRGDYVIDVVEPERVCWIKIKPHPADPYSQLTPLMSAGMAVETDYLAHIFNRNFLANEGKPSTLVSIKGNVNDEDAREIKQRFNGGVQMAGQTTVIEAEEISVADLAASPRDVQWSELQKLSKDEILLNFGVPESVMGNASGRTFDNADAERENYYIDTMQPHCDPIAFGLDPITGDTEDDLVIGYDYSQVDVLQRMAQRKRAEWREEVSAGLRTIDEYREEADKELFGVAGTRVLYLTSGAAVAKNDEDQKAIAEILGGAPVDEGGADSSSSEQGALQGVRRGLAEADRTRGNQDAAQSVRDRASLLAKRDPLALETKSAKRPRSKRTPKRNTSGGALDNEANHPYMGLRYKTEGLLEGTLTQWDVRQEDMLAKRLYHPENLKGTRFWTQTKNLPAKQKCKYCANQADKRIIHSEGMAYIPVCPDHMSKGKDDAAKCVPSGKPDPSNIVGIRDIKAETLAWEPKEYKKLNPRYIADTKAWAKELSDGMSVHVQKAMLREARKAIKNLKIDGVGQYVGEISGRDLEALLQPHYEAVMEVVEKAASNQSARVIKKIETMHDSGADLKSIERAVRSMIATRAPWRKALSTNLTTQAIEAARGAVYERARNFYTKTWQTVADERVRHSHRKADGQTRMVRNKFTVGGYKMDRPGDPSAPISEVANCRCYVRYELSDAAFKRIENKRKKAS
jgi:HK97 family phage portal protein